MSRLSAICIGVVFTFCVYGYQFGKSNHTVYLLDALHHHNPNLLANDWFTTQTFQYHAAFGWIVRFLMATHLVETGFLLGYVSLVVAFHVCWLSLVRKLGGSLKTYLVSVLLYYLSAGGTALGMYQVFQDSSFLPSNIAAVAMLWAFYFWSVDRRFASGMSFGIAGLFHLNYAVVGVFLWSVLSVWDAVDKNGAGIQSLLRSKSWWRATAAATGPSMINIALGLALKMGRGGTMPLDQFVYLYVRFRHPHHYDPRSWPIALWVCFCWAIVPATLAAIILRRKLDLPLPRRARQQIVRISILIGGLLVIALFGAGYWYLNETLIQMSLYRFSIYIQLFACIGTAILLCDCAGLTRGSLRAILITIVLLIAATPFLIWIGPRVGWVSAGGIRAFINTKRPGLLLFVLLSCAPGLHEVISFIRDSVNRNRLHAGLIFALTAVSVIGWNRWIGLTLINDSDDADYFALCHWVRDHSPTNAVFLVPPNESEFRYHAQRAIEVNFKGVPQLGGELSQWRERLTDVLGLQSLDPLPRGFDRINSAINRAYEVRPADELLATARKYGATFIVAGHPLKSEQLRQIPEAPGRYLLYELTR